MTRDLQNNVQLVNPARKYFAKYDVLLFLRHGVWQTETENLKNKEFRLVKYI